jgi:hypothetical protein
MTKGYEPKLALDMPFGEALERFVGVKPRELEANVAKSKKAKPPGGRKRAPSGDKVQAEHGSHASRRAAPQRSSG